MTLPTVEQIPTLDFSGQALWLMQAPESTIYGFVASIRRMLELTCFAEGLTYLDRRFAATMAVRTPDGNVPHTVKMALYHAEGVMRQAAKARDGERG